MPVKHSRFAVVAAYLLATCVQGATNHWAYQPLQAPQVPTVQDQRWPRTPVDSFILEKLQQAGLRPSSPAEARAVLRRLSLDLTGLPPTQAELNTFLANPTADNYQHALDQFLASPRYGERWARLWMDAIHFAETHGHDQDRIRTNAWPYRDYLVRAFNDDKPFQQFVREQIAGDVLYPDDPQATIALGLVAAGPWDESSLRDIREDTLDRQIGRYLDRDDMVSTVMQTFTSTTVQCARCHNHKFDPISQDDYYSLQAVFAGVDRANRVYDSDPAVHHRRQELLALLRRAEARDPSLLLAEEATRLAAAGEERLQTRGNWRVLTPDQVSSTNGTLFKIQGDGSMLATNAAGDADIYTIQARCEGKGWTALRLEVLTDDSLPKNGPGRADNGNFHLSEVEVEATSAEGSASVPLAHPTADFDQESWTIEDALDSNEQTAWGIHPRESKPHVAAFEFKVPLKAVSALKITLKQLHGRKHVIGKFRLAVTDTAPPVTATLLPSSIEEHLAVELSKRSETARLELGAYFYKQKVDRDLENLPTPSLVYAAASEFAPDGGLKPSGGPRLVQVLARGNILTPLHPANAGALSCITALPARFDLPNPQQEGTRRAALARWLSHHDNPLVWRSIVNRVWAWHFGHGLVETPNDFGALGAKPSHPELLDWLAVWFRDEAHGSLKQLHRLILSSAVWQQSCLVESGSSSAQEADADNRLLWHMNRQRLDAEQVRDSILLMCDRLDLRMGGPSDQQFGLKPGVHVTPRVDYTTFDVDGAAGRRRSIYRFLFRTLPDPFMDALDCPSGDELTPVRQASVTVQQALALWNNAFVVRHAEHLAELLGQSGSQRPEVRGQKSEIEEQVGSAFELILCRPPTAEERAEFIAYAQRHGLANFCRLLLNSNEFMFVN